MAMTERALWAGILAICLLFGPGPRALAAPTEGDALARAKALFAEAQQAYDRKDYLTCAKKFLEAYAARPYPEFQYNAAVCFEKAKRYAEAVTHFSEYLRLKPKAPDVAAIAKRIKILTRYLKEQAARPAPRPEARPGPRPQPATRPGPRPAGPGRPAPGPTARPVPTRPTARPEPASRPGVRPGPRPEGPQQGRPAPRIQARPAPSGPGARPGPVLPPLQPKAVVVIESEPQGATVWLDSKMKPPLGVTPLTTSLPPGTHLVIVEQKGYKPVRAKVQIRKNQVQRFYFGLSREHYLGWIQVTSNVPGALVYVDDTKVGAVGRTPYSGFQKPGRHVIWVAKPGYVTARREVEIVSGRTHLLHVPLKRVQYGWLSLTGKRVRGATVRINGERVCKAPCRNVKVPAGGHVLTVSRSGYKALKMPVRVDKGQVTEVAARLERTPSRTPAYVLYGLTAAALGGAIYTAIKAKQLGDAYERDLDQGLPVTSRDERLRQGKIYSYVADGLFGLSALLGALSLYYQFRQSGPKSKATFTIRGVSLTPRFGPTGLALSGRF